MRPKLKEETLVGTACFSLLLPLSLLLLQEEVVLLLPSLNSSTTLSSSCSSLLKHLWISL